MGACEEMQRNRNRRRVFFALKGICPCTPCHWIRIVMCAVEEREHIEMCALEEPCTVHSLSFSAHISIRIQ
jgi:hypothetical protein